MYVINYICRTKPVAAPRLEGENDKRQRAMSGASVVVTREGVLGVDLVEPEAVPHPVTPRTAPQREPEALDHTWGQSGEGSPTESPARMGLRCWAPAKDEVGGSAASSCLQSY